jgi:hypothetical protein
MTLKFSLVSDLHVNHPQPKIPYDQLEDLVIIAGDTSNGLDGIKFINKLKNMGEQLMKLKHNFMTYLTNLVLFVLPLIYGLLGAMRGIWWRAQISGLIT